MLDKKWIIVLLLSSLLLAENNETNTTKEINLLESISNLFSKKNKNESNDTNINNSIQTNIPKHISKKPKYHETNKTEETSTFESIKNLFSNKNKNKNKINNTNIDYNIIKNISAQKKNTYASKMSEFSNLNGTWHLRVMDGMDVRKARAIFDFTFGKTKAKLSGFDACNRIVGNLVRNSENNITVPKLMTTRMACRQKIHRWTRKRIHELLKEGYALKVEKRYGIEGLTIKSPSHELFFKKMGKD